MKKKISLLPKEMRDKLETKKIIKYGAIIVIIPVLVTAYNFASYAVKNKKLEVWKQNQTEADSINSQIIQKQNETQENETMIRSLELSGVPLNKFMLFMATDVPSDIRIYEVTKNVITSTSVKEDTTQNESGETGTPEQQQQQQQTEQTPASADASAQPTEETQTNAQPTEQNQEDLESIIIKGAGLKVDSVAKFVENIKRSNEYVESVEISDIQNYTNGSFNYKMFEMKVKLR